MENQEAIDQIKDQFNNLQKIDSLEDLQIFI